MLVSGSPTLSKVLSACRVGSALAMADAVGLDCEWKPQTSTGGGAQPAELLQVLVDPYPVLGSLPTCKFLVRSLCLYNLSAF